MSQRKACKDLNYTSQAVRRVERANGTIATSKKFKGKKSLSRSRFHSKSSQLKRSDCVLSLNLGNKECQC
jgi:hypothetical protein